MKKKYYVYCNLVNPSSFFFAIDGSVPEESWSNYMIAEISEGSYNAIRLLANKTVTDDLSNVLGYIPLFCKYWTLEVDLDLLTGTLFFEKDGREMAFPILSFRDARFPDKLFTFETVDEAIDFNPSITLNWFTREYSVDVNDEEF